MTSWIPSFLGVICVGCFGLGILYVSSSQFGRLYDQGSKFHCEEISLFARGKVPILLWDENLVEKIRNNELCSLNDFSNNIAVPSKNAKYTSFPMYTYESESKKSYYRIQNRLTNTSHAIHKIYWQKFGQFIIPSNFDQFNKLWRRSRLIDCLDMDMHRNSTEKHKWSETFTLKQMERLLHHFVDYGMHMVLAEGTLIGWYRECNFIPHTQDVDFAYRADEYDPKAFAAIVDKKTEFKPKHRMGKHKIDLEWTVYPSRNVSDPWIDIFEINSNKTNSYYATFRGRTRIKYTFPFLYDFYCAADFRGHLFWVTCNPDAVLTSSYGEYKVDKPSAKFAYDRDQTNFVKELTYGKEEWDKDIHVAFK